ncbi:MAG: ArsR family transcriptional regulator [Candidatus Freyarchaeota archaeon]|nr:ArsR family transcriptional regulator [Candidatus Jordarchaeia archaeon]
MTVEAGEEELVVSNENVAKIAKALSSETRWEILRLVRDRKMDVSRIAETLNQTEANISAQIKILEKAGLIRSYYAPGQHGVKKICEPAVKRVVIVISD